MSAADNNRRANNMRTIRTRVYKFDELSDDAKQTAIEQLWDINVTHEWWEFTYEDAKNVGIEIESFDLDRFQIEGKFIEDAVFTAHKIKDDHGQDCETYKTAEQFLRKRDELIDSARDEDGEFEDEHELDGKLDELEADFLQSILEDYRMMLQREYDYQTSKEAIIETIQANEYEFLKNGKMI